MLFRSRELARLGLSVGEYTVGSGDDLSAVIQRRALGLDALRAGDIRSAIRFFRSARELIGFDLVTNLCFVLLCQRTMVPSHLAEALQITAGLDKNRAYGVGDRTPEQEKRLAALSVALRANLTRVLGRADGDIVARTYADLLVASVGDPTNRPLLVEKAAYAALSFDRDILGEDALLEAFRDLWHTYPSPALALLSSVAFTHQSRELVEGRMCNELRNRVAKAGLKLGGPNRLRGLRAVVDSHAVRMVDENFGLVSSAARSILQFEEISVGIGLSVSDVLYGAELGDRLSTAVDNENNAAKNVDTFLGWAEVLGYVRTSAPVVDQLRSLLEDWTNYDLVKERDLSWDLDAILDPAFGRSGEVAGLTVSVDLEEVELLRSKAAAASQQILTDLIAVEPTLPLRVDSTVPELLAQFVVELREIYELLTDCDLHYVSVDPGEALDYLALESYEQHHKFESLHGKDLRRHRPRRRGAIETRKKVAEKIREMLPFFPRLLGIGYEFEFKPRTISLSDQDGREMAFFRESSLRVDYLAMGRLGNQLSSEFTFLGEQFPPVGAGQPELWDTHPVVHQMTGGQRLVQSQFPFERARNYAFCAAAILDTVIPALRDQIDRLERIDELGHVLDRNDELLALRRALLVRFANVFVDDVVNATKSVSELQQAMGWRQRVDRETVDRALKFIRDYNAAFATAPAVAFPDYVPLHRVEKGNLTRIEVTTADGRRERFMAVVTYHEDAEGNPRISPSAMFWDRRSLRESSSNSEALMSEIRQRRQQLDSDFPGVLLLDELIFRGMDPRLKGALPSQR